MPIEQEVDRLYEQLQDELNHPYIRRVLPHPAVDKDKLLIYYLLFRTKVGDRDAGICAKSVMIAEVGLTTHEWMTNDTLTDNSAIRRRQLTALSGDFYSAMYYYSLARCGQIDIVRWVAQAIQQFNIEKCRLYYNGGPEPDWDQAVQALSASESALIVRIAAGLEQDHWIPVIHHYFLVKRIVQERLGCMQKKALTNICKFFETHFKLKSEQLGRRMDHVILDAAAEFEKSAGQTAESCTMPGKLLDYLRKQMRMYCSYALEEG
ncbi:heptaprenyl diphosphate synthase component 1 [Sporolactobacillus vineae]|uniref:heptaprenyl diphosphate synthase component 1 n=1 Tax=Sporolactobacillus vineae TaxID=444463 RepID=UPI000288FCFB|nr:heptaprenyl diphosphate synthase component 1 [Sporolactobacillus vineae]